MKIRAPDYVETDTGNEASAEVLSKSEEPSFEDTISNILKLGLNQSKFVVDDSSKQGPELKLQVLKKMKELCIEEILPRHDHAIEAIESKSVELDYQLKYQQQELLHLVETREQLEQSRLQIEDAWNLAQAKHADLRERVKETLHKLQDCCKNKTVAESKMRSDLIELKEKTENLKVLMVDTSSKMNYYKSQVRVQTEKVKRITKPFYLDPSKSRFIKSNLSTTNQNIEDLVRRVKYLKTQTTELTEAEALKGISLLSPRKNQTGVYTQAGKP